ncbi:hypothetical protein DIPPA_06368, partial [Diplonema papillatum]
GQKAAAGEISALAVKNKDKTDMASATIEKAALNEVLAILEKSEKEQSKSFDFVPGPQSSTIQAADSVAIESSIVQTYEKLLPEFSSERKIDLQGLLNSLRTVFIDQYIEVEGHNVNYNMHRLQDFLTTQVHNLKKSGLQGILSSENEDRVAEMHSVFVNPATAVTSTVEGMQEWALSNSPPVEVSQGRKSSVAEALTGPCPKCDYSPTDDTAGRSSRKRIVKKKPRDTASYQDPAHYEAFIKSFLLLDAAVWEEIREVASDTSIPTSQCGMHLVDVVLRDIASPWKEFYEQANNYKTLTTELAETNKKLDELSAEASSLRETNILNQAFLAGDLAEQMAEEITSLKEVERQQNVALKELDLRFQRAGEEYASLLDEAKLLSRHLSRGQALLKELHILGSSIGSMIPELYGEDAARLMMLMDKVSFLFLT